VIREAPLVSDMAVTAEQMAEVDRRAMQVYRISLPQMMENAGRALARVAREHFFEGHAGGARVAVLAGRGGNGGGAMAAARRLAGWGARVHVLAMADEAAMAAVTAEQARTLRAFGVRLTTLGDGDRRQAPTVSDFDLVLDGLLGYGGLGEPRGGVRDAIAWVANAATAVLALDLPSGLDATTGHPASATVRASATVTLAAPKTGLAAPASLAHVGELYLADVGIPAEAYGGILDVAVVGEWFVEDDVVRLR